MSNSDERVPGPFPLWAKIALAVEAYCIFSYGYVLTIDIPEHERAGCVYALVGSIAAAGATVVVGNIFTPETKPE